MGVAGLHNFIKSAVRPTHISQYKHEYLAIDVSGWLYKGAAAAISYPTEITNHNDFLACAADASLAYTINMIDLMRRHEVEPIIVFDGGSLPAKRSSNRTRQELRHRHAQKAEELMRAGNRTEALAAYRKTVAVSHEMCQLLIRQLQKRNVAFFVAPYEADAQIAFLVREGYAAAAVTEDSDLLAYECPQVLFKLNRHTGTGDRVIYDELQMAEDRKGEHLFAGSFASEWAMWSSGLFTDMCILAGCDYLESGAGIGIRKAHTAVRDGRSIDGACDLLREKIGEENLENYKAKAKLVRLVYRHQRVFDPKSCRIVPLRPFESSSLSCTDSQLENYIGAHLDQATAVGVCAEATLNPVSLQPFDPYAPAAAIAPAPIAADAAPGVAPAPIAAEAAPGPRIATALSDENPRASPRRKRARNDEMTQVQTMWAMAAWAAASDECEIYQILADGRELEGTHPSDFEKTWLLMAAFQKKLSMTPELPSTLLRPAVALLALLASYVPKASTVAEPSVPSPSSADAEVSQLYRTAVVMAWRQIMLQPLRESSPAWGRAKRLRRELPPEAKVVELEIGDLRHRCRSRGGGATAINANMLRAINTYSAAHPFAEVSRSLSNLLPAIYPYLPRPEGA